MKIIFIRILNFAIFCLNVLLLVDTLKKRNKIIQIENEEERLKFSYNEIKSFKHDFCNILQAMYGYIIMKDMNGLTDMFNSLKNEWCCIKNGEDLNRKNINNPSIYSILNNKYKFIIDNGIKAQIDINADLKKINLNDFELTRIIGILMDNAIEAAEKSNDKKVLIQFKYDKLNNRNLIYIKNSCDDYIDCSKIFENNYSTKEDTNNHGFGLWKARQIVNAHSNVNLYTYKDKLFTQKLEIYNK